MLSVNSINSIGYGFDKKISVNRINELKKTHKNKIQKSLIYYKIHLKKPIKMKLKPIKVHIPIAHLLKLKTKFIFVKKLWIFLIFLGISCIISVNRLIDQINRYISVNQLIKKFG